MASLFFWTLIVALLIGIVAGAAFVPQKPATATPRTVVHFKFLKDMGLEKPSWLPDFGGGKEEEKEPVAVATAEEAEGEGEAKEGESEE